MIILSRYGNRYTSNIDDIKLNIIHIINITIYFFNINLLLFFLLIIIFNKL